MIEKFVNSQAYVDLGLPSGNLWATCDVGAHKPWECGEYFLHSELFELGLMENNSNLPNDGDFNELLKYTSKKHYTIYGQNGILLTSVVNGKSIFIPYFGYKRLKDKTVFCPTTGYLYSATYEETDYVTFKSSVTFDSKTLKIDITTHSTNYCQHIRLIKRKKEITNEI